jgi:hypothetical protein
MENVLQDAGMQVLALVLAALVSATLLDDLLADLAARIPYVGRILAPIVRRLSAGFRAWLGERVPAQADRVVRQTEAIYGPVAGSTKLQVASQTLAQLEPGLTPTEAQAAVQAAVDRAKAAPFLAGSGATSKRLDELEQMLARPEGTVPGESAGPVA